jgi:glycosyltransferase involved in cell wall biosynthesis
MASRAHDLALDGAQNPVSQPVKVLFSCSGVGIFNRGIESFFREAFDGLKGAEGLDARLIKGAGDPKENEWLVRTLPRTGYLAPMLGQLTRRNGYVVEQWSSFPGVVRRIRQFRPHVIFYSDSNLGFLLYRFRQQINVPYCLLFSNGGPCSPPFVRTDYVHQVAPYYFDEAIKFGEPPERHHLVPYGINVGDPPRINSEQREAVRRHLKLPLDRPVVLSVGWIARRHKRMDYVIEDMARLPEPRPYLQLLGAMDEESGEVLSLGKELLGPDGFGAASVPYEEVSSYYRAANAFVLASLSEGFGRVYLEAMMHGLPVIAHKYPVSEFVVGKQGRLTDLSRPYGLARAIEQVLSEAHATSLAEERWRSVRDRFSWQVLAPQYMRMFRRAASIGTTMDKNVFQKQLHQSHVAH